MTLAGGASETRSPFVGVQERDELLLALLGAASAELVRVQLFLVRKNTLHGYFAFDGQGIDELRVRQQRLPLSLLSVACRAVEDGIPFLGPLPPTDPCAALVDPEFLDASGIALVPLRVGRRPLGLLVGHPRRPVDRTLRDRLMELADNAIMALGALLEARRQEQPSGRLRIAEVAEVSEASERERQSGQIHELAKPKTAKPTNRPAPTRPAAPDPSNRRAHRREALRVEVHYQTEWGYFTGFMEDISVGGLFVTTYTRPAIGDHTELSFSIPNALGQAVECKALCEVRWLREPNLSTQQLPGMGLAFVQMKRAAYETIQSFVGGLASA